ncbi:prenyltransferase [Halorarum salinum]|uniref:Prenyltransferase n=1 Tax=Halorarum salinum TaxID=2743089 RepID=A0A7D5QBT1_9EURY|nr:prenyltransferase [Halobaculum salinum]QLG63297.1 prenyltransferase [Halobaculum salinum]
MTSNPSTPGAPASRVGALVAASRPRFWLYLAGPVLVGLAFGAPSVPALFDPRNWLLFGYFLVPANVLLYGVNDVFDREVDAGNPKKDPAEGREVRYRGGPSIPLAVVASALLGLGLFPLAPAAAWPYLAGFLLLGVGYSAPPARFKSRPPLDSLSNGLYVLPGAAAYATVAGAHPPAAALVGAWLWAMAMHTFSAVPDVGPDRDAGIETTATVLGERHALAYCTACWLLAAVAFGAVDPRLGVPLLIYPALAVGVAWTDVDVARAYWWYPAINATVGAVLTIGGLSRLVPPGAALP